MSSPHVTNSPLGLRSAIMAEYAFIWICSAGPFAKVRSNIGYPGSPHATTDPFSCVATKLPFLLTSTRATLPVNFSGSNRVSNIESLPQDTTSPLFLTAATLDQLNTTSLTPLLKSTDDESPPYTGDPQVTTEPSARVARNDGLCFEENILTTPFVGIAGESVGGLGITESDSLDELPEKAPSEPQPLIMAATITAKNPREKETLYISINLYVLLLSQQLQFNALFLAILTTHFSLA
ncbi:hypothetical protein JCM19238_2836 [Vibrio ponticus]|nr:hypothetical protein JCM19238_2836 [Vibrio ponticus]